VLERGFALNWGLMVIKEIEKWMMSLDLGGQCSPTPTFAPLGKTTAELRKIWVG
jgi:hypothetical protein